MSRQSTEERLNRMESMIQEIHAMLVMGQSVAPGEAEYRIVVQEGLKGNTKPLAEYLKRGGRIPKHDRSEDAK